MLGNAFSGWHLIAILVVILLLFGATRLPALSKSLGQSMRIFKNETRAMKEENAAEKADATGTADAGRTTATGTTEPPKP